MGMTYDTFSALLKEKKSLKLRNNVYVQQREGAIAIQLYKTDIATYFPDGRLCITVGGYNTRITTKILNEYTSYHFQHKSCFSSDEIWVTVGSATFRCTEGLTIDVSTDTIKEEIPQ